MMEMENNLAISRREIRHLNRVGAALAIWRKTCLKAVAMPLVWLRDYYSRLLERSLTTGQTLAIVNAQAAFFAFLATSEGSVAARLASMAWLVCALLRCKARL